MERQPTVVSVEPVTFHTVEVRQNVFINYAAVDQDKATALSDLLEKRNYHVWMDRKVLEGSDNWKLEIDRGLRQAFVMVSILTPDAVAPEREWVQYEQRQALDLFLPIIPLFYEQCNLPERLARINYIDVRTFDDRAVQQLLRAIEKHRLRAGGGLFDEAPAVERAFIGRREELRTLHAMITAEDLDATQTRPPIAIYGLPGSGKTMLLNELARRLGRLYPGGVIYEQRGESRVSSQAVLTRWMQRALGSDLDRDFSQEITPQQVRHQLLRFGQLMVAIDDVGAEDFPEVQRLLEALPPDTTRILTTQSREEAAAIGCQIFPVQHPLEKLEDPDALLFLKDRLAGKGPMPSDEQLLRLAHAVDGHPLALEISAARCQHTGDLGDIVDELTNDLAEGVSALRYRNLARVNASTSVTLSFDRSVRALDTFDQEHGTQYMRSFRTLGVLPGNVPLDRSMYGVSWDEQRPRVINDTLSALTDRAFVIRQADMPSHYRVPTLVNSYARELLHADPEAYEMCRRLYVHAVVHQATETFALPQDRWDADPTLLRQIAHVGRLLVSDLQLAIGVGAFDQLSKPEQGASLSPSVMSIRDSGFLELAIAFSGAIVPLARERQELGEVVADWLKLGLVASRLLGKYDEAAQRESELGGWYSHRSQYALALAYFTKAAELARQLHDGRLLARSLSEEGAAAALRNEKGDVQRAIELHNEALNLQRKLGTPEEVAETLINLGRDYWVMADADRSLQFYEEASKLNPQLSAGTLNHIGSAYFVKGNYGRAIVYFEQGLARAQQVHSARWEAENSNDLGAANLGSQHYEEAIVHLRHAIELYQRVGDRRVECISYGNLSSGLRHLKRFDEAEKAVNTGLAICREIGAKREEVWNLHHAGQLAWERGQPDHARSCYEQALKLIEAGYGVDNRTQAGVIGDYAWILFSGFKERERAIEMTKRALQLLAEKQLGSGHGFVSAKELEQRLNQMQRRGFLWFWRR